MSEATSDYTAAPLEENLFEWHFTVRGPEDSDFQVGKIFQWKLEGKYFISLAGRYLPREDPGASRISHEASRHHSPHGKSDSNHDVADDYGTFSVPFEVSLWHRGACNRSKD